MNKKLIERNGELTKLIIAGLFFVLLSLLLASVLAWSARGEQLPAPLLSQSENYRITAMVLDEGGGQGNSSNYRVFDAIGDAVEPGESNSGNFKLLSGPIPAFYPSGTAGRSIDIQEGWNYISLPLAPITPYTAEGVCSEINSQGGDVTEIDRWYNGGWDNHTCGSPSNNFDIELGSGYFIRSNAASTWVIEGNRVTTGVPFDLQVGWNSIGVPHSDAYMAESLCNEIIGQGVTAVEIDRWYASGWDGHICGLPFNDFPIKIGKGYFVKANSAGTVTPAGMASQRTIPKPLPSLVVEVEIPESGKHLKREHSKLQGVLGELMDAYEAGGPLAAQQIADKHVIKLQEGKVLFVVEGDRGEMASLAQAIVELGGEIGTVASDRISALAPVTALHAIAALPGVAYVRLPLPMVQAATTSEGMAMIGADVWHAAGIDGEGVIVAVIDFGFSNWSGLQSSGDLPPGSRLVRKNYKSTAFEDDGTHGSACAEIVYDVAPGVGKMILYAFDDDADIEAIVTDMIAEGVQVAAMSIGWVNSGPYDGTGYLDNQVNRARNDGGIFWAIAIENQAQRHYEATFTPSSVPQYHQFASDTNINQIDSVLFGVGCLIFEAGNVPAVRAQAPETPEPNRAYFTSRMIALSDGTSLDEYIINGPPEPPPGYELERATVALPEPNPEMGLNTLTVPAYRWSFGCSATSGAMIAGYYDRNGLANMYTGPTNGGVMPLDSSPWTDWTDGYGATYAQCPLTASHNGLDGRTTRGSIDDYWVKYGSTAQDPYITNGWVQHTWGDAIGDYMKTSQSAFYNDDGSTTFYTWTSSATQLTCSTMETYGISQYDGTYGRKLFYEARGYTTLSASFRPDVRPR